MEVTAEKENLGEHFRIDKVISTNWIAQTGTVNIPMKHYFRKTKYISMIIIYETWFHWQDKKRRAMCVTGNYLTPTDSQWNIQRGGGPKERRFQN